MPGPTLRSRGLPPIIPWFPILITLGFSLPLGAAPVGKLASIARGPAQQATPSLKAGALLAASPLTQCNAYLSQVPTGPLGEEHRLAELQRLAGYFAKAYPQEKAKLEPAFALLVNTPPDHPRYHWHVEALSLELNRLSLASLKDSPASKNFWPAWQRFSTPAARAPHAIDKKEECIETPDTAFQAFTEATLQSIHYHFGKDSFAKDPLAVLPRVQLLPAGSSNFFGATANSTNGHPRVCINPEEAPPLLLPKLLHELAHASNQKLWPMRDEYMKLIESYQSAAKLLDERENSLYNFDGEILSSAREKLEADALMPLIKEMATPQLQAIKALVVDRTSGAQAYKDPKRLSEHALLAFAWAKQQRTTADLAAAHRQKREPLDQERFFDEHRAYATEYLAALDLIHDEPAFFCQLWVPSYPQKRPVRFFEAYQDVEERIKTGTFSLWLANLYVKSGKYLAASLYTDGDDAKGLRPELLVKADSLLSERLNGQIPKIAAPSR